MSLQISELEHPSARRKFITTAAAASAGLILTRSGSAVAQATTIPQFDAIKGGYPYTVLAEGVAFPEGPIVMKDGSLLFVEIFGGRLSRLLPNKKVVTVANLGGGPNGAAMGPDGAVYVANNGGIRAYPNALVPDGWNGGWIDRVDPETGKFERLVDTVSGVKLNAPNDLVFDGKGGFWFTDLGRKHERFMDYGAVYYTDLTGKKTTEMVYGIPQANGIGLSPDGSLLYVAVPVTRQILVYEVEGPARLKQKNGKPLTRVLCSIEGDGIFDSLKVEQSGNVVVAWKGADPGGLVVVTPKGETKNVVFGAPISNIAFGGPDMQTMYIAAGSDSNGKILMARWPRPGLKLAYNF
ncbi:SMP-30/gluconolactonase/LRE family protein [Paraburkholderia fynbosensis]|uniref:Gluconolactonase n=1 Tax=Paraburkholderia fynbosensis TaxID=1200993 RepID=A0A6J5H1J2_9BURK|nr:SMP-30/gluconolactonase/LRE family protein [Paraburkholderia fynbosensis]CAB3810498.1 Gluconolactonase [Paraburkholderia fynbosensis]